MKRVGLALTTVIALLSVLATSAHAQRARSGAHSEVVASAFSAEVTGTVKSVNQKSGKLVLDTPDGPVNVKFPAEAVQGVKKGDQVTVSVGLVKPPPSASPQTSPGTTR